MSYCKILTLNYEQYYNRSGCCSCKKKKNQKEDVLELGKILKTMMLAHKSWVRAFQNKRNYWVIWDANWKGTWSWDRNQWAKGKRCSTIGKEQPLLELATVFFSLPAMGARTSPKENRGWAKQSRPKEVWPTKAVVLNFPKATVL